MEVAANGRGIWSIINTHSLQKLKNNVCMSSPWCKLARRKWRIYLLAWRTHEAGLILKFKLWDTMNWLPKLTGSTQHVSRCWSILFVSSINGIMILIVVSLILCPEVALQWPKILILCWNFKEVPFFSAHGHSWDLASRHKRYCPNALRKVHKTKTSAQNLKPVRRTQRKQGRNIMHTTPSWILI